MPLILAAAFLLRLYFVWFSAPAPHYEYPVGMDEANYIELSSNIREFGVFGAWSESFFTRSTRSPLYPAILAFSRAFSENTAFVAQCLNILFDLVNIVLIFEIAQVFFGRRTAFCASAAWAFYGPAVFYCSLAASETISIAIFLCILLSLRGLRSNYAFWLAPLCLSSALMIHIKPVFLIVTPLIPIIVYFSYKNFPMPLRRRAFRALLPFFMTAIMCLPWALRNHSIHRSFVPVCTVAGWHLYDSVFKAEKLDFSPMLDYIYSPKRAGYGETDYYNEGMREFWGKSPIEFLKMPGRGFFRLIIAWTPENFWKRFYLPKAYFMPLRMPPEILLVLPDFEGFFLVLLISTASALVLRRRFFVPAALRFIHLCGWESLICPAYIFAHVLGFPMMQYRLIAEPFLLILAISFLFEVWGFNSGARRDSPRMALAFSVLGPICLAVIGAILLREGGKTVRYPENAGDIPGFAEVHAYQRQNNGQIIAGQRFAEYGIVKYTRKGLRFDGGDATARKDEESAVARFYVQARSQSNPTGIGDAKLNFRASSIPPEGCAVAIRGVVRAGFFRELIADVESWEPISQ